MSTCSTGPNTAQTVALPAAICVRPASRIYSHESCLFRLAARNTSSSPCSPLYRKRLEVNGTCVYSNGDFGGAVRLPGEVDWVLVLDEWLDHGDRCVAALRGYLALCHAWITERERRGKEEVKKKGLVNA